VRRRLVDLGALAVLATVALAVLLVLGPISAALAVRVYVLALTALVLAGALAALPARGRSAFDAALRRPPRQQTRPPQLERMERAVTLGVGGTYDFHARLRPLLREIAAARLATARGVELDTDAGRAPLGEDAWELLRPDRPPPEDRFARGVDEQRLRRLVAILEDL
jgi:hypothetical protein